MLLYIEIDYMIMKVKEKLVQKEGEASMLASVNKQVLLRDIFQTILFNDFDNNWHILSDGGPADRAWVHQN